MKNLFLALTLTGIIGASSVGTIAAITHTKTVACGEECKHKKNKKCSKGDACTKSTANTNKKCSAEATKKCCSKSAKASACTDKGANNPQTTPQTKPLEVR